MRNRYELQRRIDEDPNLSKLSVLSLDPGAMGGTALAKRGPLLLVIFVRGILPLPQNIIVYFSPQGFFLSPRKSAGDVLRACFDEEALENTRKQSSWMGEKRWKLLRSFKM